MFKTNDLVATYTDEEFFQYAEKFSGSEKALISLGFMMGQIFEQSKQKDKAKAKQEKADKKIIRKR